MPVDGIGLAMLVVWVGALQIMLDTGKDAGWFDSTQIIALSIVAAVGFVRLHDLAARTKSTRSST